MGRRGKSAKKVATKAKLTVPKTFKCPLCGHPNACEVKFNKATQNASITCRVCDATNTSRTTILTEPVDVFTDWLDHIEEENANVAAAAAAGQA